MRGLWRSKEKEIYCGSCTQRYRCDATRQDKAGMWTAVMRRGHQHETLARMSNRKKSFKVGAVERAEARIRIQATRCIVYEGFCHQKQPQGVPGAIEFEAVSVYRSGLASALLRVRRCRRFAMLSSGARRAISSLIEIVAASNSRGRAEAVGVTGARIETRDWIRDTRYAWEEHCMSSPEEPSTHCRDAAPGGEERRSSNRSHGGKSKSS